MASLVNLSYVEEFVLAPEPNAQIEFKRGEYPCKICPCFVMPPAFLITSVLRGFYFELKEAVWTNVWRYSTQQT